MKIGITFKVNPFTLNKLMEKLENLFFVWNTGKSLTHYIPKKPVNYLNIYIDDNGGIRRYCTYSVDNRPDLPLLKNEQHLYDYLKIFNSYIRQYDDEQAMFEIHKYYRQYILRSTY